MSTKATIFLSKDDEHIYSDCVNVWKKDNEYREEITFEFKLKNINIDSLDDEEICFTLNKQSDIYEYFYNLFNK